MLRLIHTADWHLGHTLHSVSREHEHRCFLDWLLRTLDEEDADALLIAGDLFDSANPPASAQSMLYDFLAAARQRRPRLEVVIVAGNHDSPARIEAPAPLLKVMGASVVGLLPRTAAGSVDLDRVLVPLHDGGGEVAAWCAAVPYLRPADLPPCSGNEDPLVEGVRRVYHEVLEGAAERSDATQPIVAMGHCYMVGTRLSELSERRILGGGQHALPAAIFASGATYAALGHLHLAQKVGGADHLRYSGSPIPLSLAENAYPHQVLRVDLSDRDTAEVTPLRVPRTVRILRLPEGGPEPLAEVLSRLEELQELDALPGEQQPLLEVRVLLDQVQPDLRQQVTAAVAGAPVRLVKISPHYPERDATLADSAPLAQLDDLRPEEVFVRCHRRQHGDGPPDELMAAFAELLEQVQAEEP